ncbi:MAG: heme ABC transporter ATP-binding protein [Thermoprotei archaeon]|nr:MAG: heme ABC transporter ATP-binding protein [Thermoprotei archaeon]
MKGIIRSFLLTPPEKSSLLNIPRGEVVVKMQGITKRFPGVTANDHVDFELRAGEIHALLGENGAGKTTLMNILYGLYRPDEGEIYVGNRRVKIGSPKDAIKLGIAMVHQHFKLIESLTVAENIALCIEEYKFFSHIQDVKKNIGELSEKYGLRIDPDARVWQLSAGEKQRVEILKALIRRAKILILDEPTSVLTPPEKRELFKILRRMAEEGCGIVFITHKLHEVMEVSDRVTVLRKGRVVATLQTSETNPKQLAKLMLGKEIPLRPITHTASLTYKEAPILEVRNLYVLNDRGSLAVKGVSFEVFAGEIFGIAGVSGNGQRELIEAITGLRKVKLGNIILMGEEVTNRTPKDIIERGVAFIPEDRLNMGIAQDLSISENLILKKYRYTPFSGHLFLNLDHINKWVDKLIKEYNIITPSSRLPAGVLSGGNIQRLILARELSGNPKLIVASNPTRGLDVAATNFVRSLLIEQKKRGVAVLLVSEDLEELLMLADRIAVIFEGKFMGVLPTSKADVNRIGLMMAGIEMAKVRS